MYDLLIQNADILDGTGAPAFRADAAIKDGKIVQIAAGLSSAAQVIDASGLTLSPGWIDSHSHSDRTILTWPDQKEKVEQGITFSITGQCGSSPAPIRRESGIETVGDYLKQAAAVPQGSGSALLIGHNALRRAVMGEENRAPSSAELKQMKALLREGMAAGAIGLSFGLYYIPGCYATLDEAIALARTAGECGGLLAAHIRNESHQVIEAVEEFLSIVKASGCRGVFSHHKSYLTENWGKVRTTIPMIEKAIAEGADLYMDAYPYCATSTTLLARFVPCQFHPPGTTSAVKLLDDPVIFEQIRFWGQQCWNNDLSWTLLTSCPGHPEYAGKTVNDIADLRGEPDRMVTALQLIRETDGRANAAFFTMCEDDVRYVLKHPRTMICTDSASAADSAFYHPRLRGSFPRALGRYVREQQLVPLPEMIRKMTSMPAHVYGLHGKGRIAEGMDADLCLFDPETIIDRADYAHCSAPNDGLSHVIINGKIVLENGVYNHTRAASVFLR